MPRARPRYAYDKLHAWAPLRPDHPITHTLEYAYQTWNGCEAGTGVLLHFKPLNPGDDPIDCSGGGVSYPDIYRGLVSSLIDRQRSATNLYIPSSKVRFCILLEEELLNC